MRYIFRNGQVLEYSYDNEIRLDEYQLKEGEHWVTTTEENSPDGKGHHFVVNQEGEITKGLGGTMQRVVGKQAQILQNVLQDLLPNATGKNGGYDTYTKHMHRMPNGSKIAMKKTNSFGETKSVVATKVGYDKYEVTNAKGKTLTLNASQVIDFIDIQRVGDVDVYIPKSKNDLGTVVPRELGLSAEHQKTIQGIITKSPQEYQKAIQRFTGKFNPIQHQGEDGVSYNKYDNVIKCDSFDKDEYHKKGEAFIHEFTHNLDFLAGNGESFASQYKGGMLAKTIKSEFAKYLSDIENEAKAEFNKQYSNSTLGKVEKWNRFSTDQEREKSNQAFLNNGNYKQIEREMVSQMQWNNERKVAYATWKASHMQARTQDLFSSMGLKTEFGHSNWNDGKIASEGFANIVGSMVANRNALKEMKKYFPQTVKLCNEILKEIGNG